MVSLETHDIPPIKNRTHNGEKLRNHSPQSSEFVRLRSRSKESETEWTLRGSTGQTNVLILSFAFARGDPSSNTMVLARVTEEDDRFEAWIVSCFV